MVLLWVGLPAWSSPVLRKESYLIYTGELASMMV